METDINENPETGPWSQSQLTAQLEQELSSPSCKSCILFFTLFAKCFLSHSYFIKNPMEAWEQKDP